jgi:lauroyl/myristoyl acyltransferase
LQIVAERLQSRHQPTIQLEGRERLDDALALGRGAILWFDNFVHHSTIGNRAFAEAGYSCWHVSSFDHGFSTSAFSKRHLNPIQLTAEARYVAGRIEFDGNTALAATREIRDRLAENGIVRITNNAYIGRKIVDVPFGVYASLPVAAAPLNFGLKAAAPVLPVAVFEVVPFAQYRVSIAPPIALDASGGRETAFAKAMGAYSAYLERLVRAHPEQWRGWQGVREHPPG